jgi:tRNA A-37 threonylcarbamoyl transferase component Bud32
LSRAINQQSGFVSQRRGSLAIYASGNFMQDLLTNIGTDPDQFFDLAGCEIIKDQKKIKVARAQIKIQGNLRTIYIKRYNAFSWRYRFGSLFQSSGAIRSLQGAAMLFDAGIRTAPPLAAVDSRSWGMLNSSFFLSEEVENGKTADAYWRENLLAVNGREGVERRKRFLQRLGELFRSLHQHNVYHNDLKDANIIVRPGNGGRGEEFCLLDLEGIRRYRRLNRRRRTKNLVQLNRTLGNYLRRTDKLYFLASYLGPRAADRADKRAWIAGVLRQSNRLDRLRRAR